MNICIDNLGRLQIFRGGKWKLQFCPFTSRKDEDVRDETGALKAIVVKEHCGDWCPLFGERSVAENYGIFHFKICKKTFVLTKGEFTDERTS